MKDFGLSPSRLWVLTYLARNPDSTTRQISEKSDLSYGALGRVVTSLVEAGLVCASEGPDRQGKRVTYSLDAEVIRRDLEDLWAALLPGEPLPPKSDA